MTEIGNGGSMKRFVLVLLAVAAFAVETPQLKEINRLKVVNAYQRAVIAQAQLDAATRERDAAFANYGSVTAEVTQDEKLPVGTMYQVNVAAGSVSVEVPKPAPAPEKK